ncbi:hypothetical protein CORC01_11332 [Colletotrichum orchidophilum]|uniref:Uncharacterized protein n=1 Tax=Colletotrichum orchidophilum TaxID=1209926 RepID=A0A1G4AWE9_9PEZI|nr:uncharacterized protein CORC01_11332 [Colletotrichum orchidophilum]OHE93382.1 hypothetical protein CORC01_11332 [Colletotrichum orchidophilum]
MQFSTILAIFAASFVAAAPSTSPLEVRKDPGAIVTCETQTAVDQVACIEKCVANPSCITACSLDAANKYTACAV